MGDGEHPSDVLENRLLGFGARAIRLCSVLMKSRGEAELHIGRQLIRSATAPVANYAEARGAESKADFVHKLGIVQKELNESIIWLKLIITAELLAASKVTTLINDGRELARIITASRKTARSRPTRRTESDNDH